MRTAATGLTNSPAATGPPPRPRYPPSPSTSTLWSAAPSVTAGGSGTTRRTGGRWSGPASAPPSWPPRWGQTPRTGRCRSTSKMFTSWSGCRHSSAARDEEAAMRYYADGDHKLICVDFPADKVGLPLSRVTARKYRGGKGWIDPEDIGRDSHSLAVEALYSGNYYM